MRKPYPNDPNVCSQCWGIIPPEGVQMVPDDGTTCTCDVTPDDYREA